MIFIGLLTLLRLWRVLRVINGFILGAKQAADKRVHEQKRRVEELEKELSLLKGETVDSKTETKQNDII